jgi:hypothetical protein
VKPDGGVSAADSREVLRPAGEGFQVTPFGMFALDTATPVGGEMHGAAVHRPVIEAHGETVQQPRALAAPQARPALPIAPFDSSPRGVVRAAKARIKELRTFLREAKKAEKELRELERLVAAAKKPLAPVRDIRRTAS